MIPSAIRCKLLTAAIVACLGVLLTGSLTSPVSADGSRYSLGTIQHDESLELVAGSQVTTILAFYNVDGSLPTHVRMYVADTPDGWGVTLTCRSSDSASSSSSEMALTVPPSDVHDQSPDCQAAGQRAEYLPGRGYVCARIVEVTMEIPSNAGALNDASVRLVAVATWAEAGSPAQERSFDYNVSVLPGETSSSGNTTTIVAAVVAVAAVGLVLLARHLAK